MTQDTAQALSFVIVGHVDHGKSTLIGRLLYDTGAIPEDLIEDIRSISEELGKEMEFAYLLDALEEERKENITIDTTQRFFRLEEREFVIIDAPGHKEFLRNMITGASMAEAAVLMLDVSRGVEEQTQRHAHFLKLLGVENIVVAVNKMDLVDYKQADFEKAAGEVRELADSLGLSLRAVVPISAKQGLGISTPTEKFEWFDSGCLLDELSKISPKPSLEKRPLRLVIQSTYKRNDEIFHFAKVESGTVCKGNQLKVSGAETSAISVNKICAWPEAERDAVGAGECCALALSDPDMKRGQMLFSEGEGPNYADQLTATVFWMNSSPLTQGESLKLRLLTQEVTARVQSISGRMNSASLEAIGDDSQLGDTEVAEVSFKLEAGISFDNYDQFEECGRFVLAREIDVVGGGLISSSATKST
jgi:small GTP-binding protein